MRCTACVALLGSRPTRLVRSQYCCEKSMCLAHRGGPHIHQGPLCRSLGSNHVGGEGKRAPSHSLVSGQGLPLPRCSESSHRKPRAIRTPRTQLPCILSLAQLGFKTPHLKGAGTAQMCSLLQSRALLHSG